MSRAIFTNGGCFTVTADAIADAWRQALSAECPIIIEFRAGPNVPPLPPHMRLADAKNFITMTLDEPELGSVIKNSARQLLAEVPSHSE